MGFKARDAMRDEHELDVASVYVGQLAEMGKFI